MFYFGRVCQLFIGLYFYNIESSILIIQLIINYLLKVLRNFNEIFYGKNIKSITIY